MIEPLGTIMLWRHLFDDARRAHEIAPARLLYTLLLIRDACDRAEFGRVSATRVCGDRVVAEDVRRLEKLRLVEFSHESNPAFLSTTREGDRLCDAALGGLLARLNRPLDS